MQIDDSLQDRSEVTAEFERRLEALIVESFARGAVIEGVWGFTVPVTDAPDWEVTVQRVVPDGDPSYEPTLLEE